MTHLFTVTLQEFEDLQANKRHLITKDSANYATADKAIIQPEGSREQLEFTITSIEHGPASKFINGHYCLIGLYAPYTAINDIPDTVG